MKIYQEGKVRSLALEDISINAENSQQTFAGGIAGVNYGSVLNCHTKVSAEGGSTISASGEYAFAGGIVGLNLGETSMCSNEARIEVDGGTGDNPFFVAGGIAAINAGTIDNSFNVGNINALDEAEDSAVRLGGLLQLMKRPKNRRLPY